VGSLRAVSPQFLVDGALATQPWGRIELIVRDLDGDGLRFSRPA
jgi:hypothetical protein